MSKLKLCLYGNEVLRKKTKFIKKYDNALSNLVDDMFETMYEAAGIGLAAPQIGILKKLIVIDTTEEGEKIALANPKLLWEGGDTVSMKEGCLSIPGVEADVDRPEKVKVRGDDPFTGEEIIIEAEGLYARVFQHEIDHLNGVLFIDHLTPSQRSHINRKLQELELV